MILLNTPLNAQTPGIPHSPHIVRGRAWPRGVFVFLLLLSACAPSEQPQGDYPVTSLGSAGKSFTQGPSPAYDGERVVDSSVLTFRGRLLSFFDWSDGLMFGSSAEDGTLLSEEAAGLNFTYVLPFGDRLLRFGERSGDIFLSTSADGLLWAGPVRVLTHDPDPSSPWHLLWNVAVDVAADGTWYLFAECGTRADQSDVGLCQAHSSDGVNWVRTSEAQVLRNAGNPYLKVMPDGGLFLIHGVVNEAYGPFDSAHWFVGASVCDVSGSCTKHYDKFALGTPGIHDADPHAAERTDGSLLIVFSVDQSHCQSVVAQHTTLQSLYSEVISE